MDGKRFDDVARALGAGLSRRGALAALGGIGLGAGLGALDIAARGRKGGPSAAKKKKCTPGSPPELCCKDDGTCSCRTPSVKAGSNATKNGAKLQAAIDAAAPGAVLRLPAGTYDAPLASLPGGRPGVGFLVVKPLTLARCGDGEVVLRGAMGVGDPAEVEWAATVDVSAESGTVRLEGLHVTCGDSRIANTGIGGYSDSGAVKIEIVDCVVEDNPDGGVTLSSGTFTIAESTIRNNRESVRGGGGVLFYTFPGVDSTLTITDSLIEGNASHSGDPMSWAGSGGGIAVLRSEDGTGAVELTLLGTTVRGNVAGPEDPANPDRLLSGWGGGLFAGNTVVTIGAGTVFEDNVARKGSWCDEDGECQDDSGAGGGLAAWRYETPVATAMRVTVAPGSQIRGNTAEANGTIPGLGGGVFAVIEVDDAIIDIAPGTVTGNDPDDCAGDVTCPAGASGRVAVNHGRRDPAMSRRLAAMGSRRGLGMPPGRNSR